MNQEIPLRLGDTYPFCGPVYTRDRVLRRINLYERNTQELGI